MAFARARAPRRPAAVGGLPVAQAHAPRGPVEPAAAGGSAPPGARRRVSTGALVLPPPMALLVLHPLVAGAAPDCWTHSFTPGQCCNAIYGILGNRLCWDGGQFTFENCCGGRPYEPKDCSEFVSMFSFNAISYRGPEKDPVKIGEHWGKAWSLCSASMEEPSRRCNAPNATAQSCPECAALSPHLPTYIRCVRAEQELPTPSGSRPASPEGGADSGFIPSGTAAIVGGHQFPTLLRPRWAGREFSWVASAFDMTVGTQLLSEGRWMPQELRLLEGFLPVSGVVVDAGANIGGFAVPLSKHVGPDGEVHAFEPFRGIFQILTANCAINGLISCHTYHNALGDRSERRRLQSPGLNAVGNPSKSFVVEKVASDLLVHRDGRMETVEFVRLDDKLELARLDLIKIDVESAEFDVLLGAERTIALHRPWIYVEDSEAEMETMTKPSRLMNMLGYRHAYECINLYQSGMLTMTSLLCGPKERTDETMRRLRSIDFRITT